MEELVLIQRLAAADLSAETVRVGVRLLALMEIVFCVSGLLLFIWAAAAVWAALRMAGRR